MKTLAEVPTDTVQSWADDFIGTQQNMHNNIQAFFYHIYVNLYDLCQILIKIAIHVLQNDIKLIEFYTISLQYN